MVATATVATVAGPTAGIEISNATPRPYEWLTDPLSANFTISGTITLNLWAYEAAAANNVSINAVIDKIDGATGTITQIAKTARTTEVAAGSPGSVNNFTVTPTSTACKRGDRIRLRVFADDSTSSMGAGGTASFSYASPTAAVSGDSYVQFTENLTFDTTVTPTGSVYYLTGTAESIDPGAAVEKKAAKARGGGSTSAATTTVAGPTAGIQATDSAGGATIEWYTPPLEAFTLGGLALFNIRASVSPNVASYVRAEIAVVAGDGSGATTWAYGFPSQSPGGLTTTDRAIPVFASGADVSVTAGQRLRFRVYIDDSTLALVTGATVTITYNGATAAVAGDSYVMLPVAVTEQTPSGTAWTQPVNDTLSVADAVATQADKAAAIPDTLAVADAVTSQGVFARTVPDTVAIADTATVARDIAQSVVDTLSLADATALARAITQPVADTVGLADLATTAAGKGVTVNDTVALADTVGFDQALTVADTVALSDVVAQAEEIHIADTLAITDLADPVKTTGGVVLNQPVADTVSVADAVRFDRAATITDTLGVADQLASQAALQRTLADTVAPADSVATQAALSRTIADTVPLTDAASPVKTTGVTAWTVPLADTVTVADTTSSASVYVRTVADTVTVADQLTAAAGTTYTRLLTDTVTVSDQTGLTSQRQLDLADTLEVFDEFVFMFEQLIPAGWITFATGNRIGVLYPGRLDTAAQTLGGITVPGRGEGELALTGVGGIARTGG